MNLPGKIWQRPILLLHGALGTKAQLQPLATLLAPDYDVHLLDFPGHGSAAAPAADLDIPLLAEAVAAYLQSRQLPALPVFGYSMGGYVAMYLARHYPGLVSRVITLGTKYHWDESTAARETGRLDATVIAEKVPAFAAALQERHTHHDWKTVLSATAVLMQGLGQRPALTMEDYTAIDLPCLLMLGDRDNMVTFSETLAIYQALPQPQLAMLPGTPHPIEKADPALLATLLQRFVGE